MTVLRLIPVGGSAIDRAIASVGSATLCRRPDGAFVDVPLADVGPLVRILAFAGVRAEPCAAELIAAPKGTFPAVGVDLAPLPSGLGAVDVLRVRRLGLGAATGEIMRRRLGGLIGPGDDARARCRAVLRGTDAVMAWGRAAWAPRSALRRARPSLRPVVFDRDAVGRADLGGRAYASDGAISRWLFE